MFNIIQSIPVGALPISLQVIGGLAVFFIIMEATRRSSLATSALFCAAWALVLCKPSLLFSAVTIAVCSVIALLSLSIRGCRKSHS